MRQWVLSFPFQLRFLFGGSFAGRRILRWVLWPVIFSGEIVCGKSLDICMTFVAALLDRGRDS